MKKNDFIAVAILVALMFGWMAFAPAIEERFFPREEQAEPAPIGDSSPVEAIVGAVTPPPAVVEEIVEQAEKLDLPEVFQTLENDQIELRVSSYGGAIVSAVLKDYPERNEEGSGPVVLDFASAPALRYDGVPLAAGTLAEMDGALVYTAPIGEGQLFKRTLTLENDYLVMVQDEFINNANTPWSLPVLRLPTGPMQNSTNTTAMRGMTTLGVDAFSASDGVQHPGKKLQNVYDPRPFWQKMFGGAYEAPASLEFTPDSLKGRKVDWVAAKNKFFVQIITTPEVSAKMLVLSERDQEENSIIIKNVAAALEFDGEVVAANGAVQRTTQVYIGPKDFGFLKTQGMEQTGVMEFKSTGFWKFMNPIMYPIKLGLLWGLTHFALFGSYGIAILILTVIVRVLFWPLTHKSTESMKRMQALQPQMQALKEKYKDNPQRMQQETMALYRENKVNPMGGCLPMLVQIPVFIALFSVLRSAIELRYSSFLWINDLSEPENLFAGMIPIIGSLNILPLLMSATMFWQQKLTTGNSVAATPEQAQQQKMMQVMMPIMMLFFFYSMPSGLVLYWTTSQVIMIGQLLLKRVKSK